MDDFVKEGNHLKGLTSISRKKLEKEMLEMNGEGVVRGFNKN